MAAADSADTHGTVRKQCSLHDVTFEENITSKTGPHAHVVHFFSHETLKGNILKCCHLLLLFFFSLSDGCFNLSRISECSSNAQMEQCAASLIGAREEIRR